MSLSKESKGNKWKGYYDNTRKYKPEWVKRHPWVKRAEDGSENAFCSFCKVTINPKLSNLKQHEDSTKHKNVTGATSSNRKITMVSRKENEVLKKIELKFAAAITCHCAIRSIDHIGEIIVQNGRGSQLEEMKLHRTKCSSLIKNVILVALHEELCQDIAGKKFCVMIDESTDISCIKHLCIAVRYFSEKEERIKTSFLELIPITSATGEDIFSSLKSSLENAGLKLEDCIGFGSDGASAMVGQHNSVWSRIRNASPSCVLMRCICHSLALCIKHAFEKLPSNLGFLLSEIPRWFSNSALRRDSYKSLFQTINGDDERVSFSSAFQKMSTTRWLVRGKLIYNILVSWEELKTYFSIAELEMDSSARYKAKLIGEMLKDDINKLYFHFVSPIVNEFERVNAFFQATQIDPNDMSKELNLFHSSLRSRLFFANGSNIPIERVDFGAKYIYERDHLIYSSNNNSTVVQKVNEMDSRCLQMLLEAERQVRKRLPCSEEMFLTLSFLHPSRVLRQIDFAPLAQLPMQHLIHGENTW